jgi:serine/threonine protein kinase
LYIFEELITGGDLLSYVRHKGGHLKEVEAGVIVRQVAEALNYLHDKNIVHRDLKPDNILIASHSESARVVLTDFGTAIDISDKAEKQIRRMNTSTGTVEYAAP